MALPKEARACRHDLGVGGGASEISVVANARIPVASELSEQAHARKDGVSRGVDSPILEARPRSAVQIRPNRGGILQELMVPEHSRLRNEQNLSIGKAPGICETSAKH
jgi:hypothetical protein